MRRFDYIRADSIEQAVHALAAVEGARALAGGDRRRTGAGAAYRGTSSASGNVPPFDVPAD